MVPEFAYSAAASAPAALINELERFPVLILKDFLSPDTCTAARGIAATFMDNNPPQVQDRFECAESYYSVDIEPPKSTVRRVLRSMIVAPTSNDTLWRQLEGCFRPMAAFHSRLVGENAGFSVDADTPGYRPQIIHYPRGGGYFDLHEHPHLPMRYGMILNLSRKGEDFKRGQTYFMVGKEKISIDAQHLIGDLCVFRYDLKHGIDPVDPEFGDYKWDESGRWTAILPILKKKHK